MKKKHITILLAAALIAVLTACQSNPASGKGAEKESSAQLSSEATGSTEDGADAQEGASQASDKGIWDPENRDARSGQEEAQQQELYNTYIEVNNFMVGRLNESLQRYFEYVNYQEEFEPLEKDYDCYSIMDSLFTYLEEANTMAVAKSEKDALDEAFLAMYPSIKQVMTTLNDIYDYTDIKSYLDDDYAKGKEYHAVLWQAFAEYQTTGDAFMTELDKVANEHNNAFLEELKNQGMDVLYSVNVVMNTAQAIEEELYLEEVTDDNILDMDLEIIQPLYDTFVAEVGKVLEYSKDEEKLKAEGIPLNSVSWDFFLDSMKDTKTSLTEVLQHVKEQKPLSESDKLITSIAGNTSIGSFQTGLSEMIDNYNDFIGAY